MQVEKYLHLSRARIESEIIPLSFSLANVILLIDQPSTNWYFAKLSSANSLFWKERARKAASFDVSFIRNVVFKIVIPKKFMQTLRALFIVMDLEK